MKRFYKLLRILLVTAILVFAVLPAVLYVALSLSGVQRKIADRLEGELTELLDAKVTIGSLGIVPFNRVMLRRVSVEPTPGDTALYVENLGAGVSLWSLMTSEAPRVNYLSVFGLNARLRRDSLSAPLNIQPIIDALSPKDKTKPPTKFDLRVSTVIIRSSSVRYDVLDQPRTPGHLNPAHLAVRNIRADINLPKIANNDFTVNLHRMALDEQSGLSLRQLAGDFHVSDKELAVRNLDIELPASRLMFADMQLPLDGLKNIRNALRDNSLNIRLTDDSHVWLPDLKALWEPLDDLEMMALFHELELKGKPSDLTARLNLELESFGDVELNARGYNLELPERHFDLRNLTVSTSSTPLYSRLAADGVIPANVAAALNSLGAINLQAKGRGELKDFTARVSMASAAGKFILAADGGYESGRDFGAEVQFRTEDGPLDLSAFLPGHAPAGFEGAVEGFAGCRRGVYRGSVAVALTSLTFNGITVDNISTEGTLEDNILAVTLDVDDPKLAVALDGTADISKTRHDVKLNLDLRHLFPDRLGLWQAYPGGCVSGRADVDMEGTDWRTMEGYATFSDLTLKPVDREAFVLRNISYNSRNLEDGGARIDLHSDYLDGTVLGELDVKTLGHSVLDVLAEAFPALLPGHVGHSELTQAVIQGKTAANGRKGSRGKRSAKAKPLRNPQNINDFQFNFTIKETERPAEFFNLPISVIYPVSIVGAICEPDRDLELNISAPYLRQGSKLIENTALSAYVDGGENRALLNFTTVTPTKGGPMTLRLDALGHDNVLRTAFNWAIDRDRAYNGSVKLETSFSRPENEPLNALVNIRRSELTFNDSTWVVEPSTVRVQGKQIDVDGIHVNHGRQFVKIDGRVSEDPNDQLTLDLRDFSLDYLFESLGIDAAMLGGDATGTFYASDLYSGYPVLQTPGLNVKSISYNQTVLGDAIVKSHFEPSDKSVVLSADIDRDGLKSYINGAIFAARDSLDLSFDCDRVPVGFLEHYMSAFASDVTGYASGHARVFGTFKYIDCEGDVFADSVKMKLNFTNTYYLATDSVHIRPGFINLNGITLHDPQGHSANLNGWVRHNFFKEPRFDFSITNARNLLCYNETPKENPRWYGRVYGNGGATVHGVPGRVDINVDMTTAPSSTFTFVLSDQIEAEQYSFLTFRDKNRYSLELRDSLEFRDTSMDLVNELRERAARHEDTSSSDYNISIQMGITPQAEIVLVMDPVGGDRIRAYGSGHIRMDYGSANNELKMFGNYTLDRGNYNFTLQDIIIKDFTIKSGSEIAFNGDPYAAQLDIRAAYSLNANLSDLDESFLNDNELNRTNVPVNAIMKVSGDIRQPEIAFDLEFPTLTSDIYRKVRSIISTDEMMNRQILYLLALNRFYTPDYMSGATRGNELVSVASSTLSSQLGNILGQISDNWNIAPTFRSSRGDFSDVEVDVALSSRLLNNRLLFNGNFGYRDESLNSNQFVGDFDLEYLLNRSGNFRLKAYNRYNDQNYYLRTALTTQGVGFVWRKDFDSLTSFLRPVFRWFRPVGKKDGKKDAPAAPKSTSEDTLPSAKTVAEKASLTNPTDTIRPVKRHK